MKRIAELPFGQDDGLLRVAQVLETASHEALGPEFTFMRTFHAARPVAQIEPWFPQGIRRGQPRRDEIVEDGLQAQRRRQLGFEFLRAVVARRFSACLAKPS